MAKKKPTFETMLRGLRSLIASAAGATRRQELGKIHEKCDAVFAKIKEIREELEEQVKAGLFGAEKAEKIDMVLEELGFYIEDLQPGDRLSFNFSVKAMYPVKAKGTSSQAYSYYKPEIRGETLSSDINVN